MIIIAFGNDMLTLPLLLKEYHKDSIFYDIWGLVWLHRIHRLQLLREMRDPDWSGYRSALQK